MALTDEDVESSPQSAGTFTSTYRTCLTSVRPHSYLSDWSLVDGPRSFYSTSITGSPDVLP